MPPRPPDQGVLFPGPADAKGKRATTQTGKDVFAAAVGAIDQDLASKVAEERKWRGKYAKHLVAQVEASAKSPQAALDVAKAGLAFVHSNFEFVRGDDSMSVEAAMSHYKGTYYTGTIEGATYGQPFDSELVIPYNKAAARGMPTHKGDDLRGDALVCQVEEWVRRGVIELSCGQAIIEVANSPDYRDLSGRYFVLFGATSAMGPLDMLLSLGAHVIAIDLGGGSSDFSKKIGPKIWGGLIKRVRNSRGAMTFPMGEAFSASMTDEQIASTAGCNLLEDVPEIKNWLLSLDDDKRYKDKPFTLGCYAYLDADRFVRIAIAMDAICKELIAKRKAGTVSLAYLCTPTDVHLCTASANAAQKKALRRQDMLQAVLVATGYLKKNVRKPVQTDSGDELYTVDAIVNRQGPNYILAKRIQHWRAMVARCQDGCVVSSNVAPSTATKSVTSNRLFAMGYEVMHNFRPLEVATPELSNSAMTAMLLHDLLCPSSPAQPTTHLANPLSLFTEGAFHGGAYRAAHKMDSFDVATIFYYLYMVLVSVYMTLYNCVATAGWAYCAFLLSQFVAMPVQPALWTNMGAMVSLTQFTAVLEVVHSCLGFVRAGAFTTALQVTSRLGVVGLLNTAGQHVPNWVLIQMLVAWCITEIIRYSFFALKCMGVSNKSIMGPYTWLRYSTFLPLYPIGTSGELISVYYMLDYASKGLAAVVLDNETDMLTIGYTKMARAVEAQGMDMKTFGMYVVYPTYAIGFPFLYGHMIAQRKNTLGKKGKKGKAGKSKKE